jgi:hypothetical protein
MRIDACRIVASTVAGLGRPLYLVDAALSRVVGQSGIPPHLAPLVVVKERFPLAPMFIFKFSIGLVRRHIRARVQMLQGKHAYGDWNREMVQQHQGFWLHSARWRWSGRLVHISAVERAGLSTLVDGQKVNYEIQQDRRTGKSSAGNLSKAG